MVISKAAALVAIRPSVFRLLIKLLCDISIIQFIVISYHDDYHIMTAFDIWYIKNTDIDKYHYTIAFGHLMTEFVNGLADTKARSAYFY